MANSIERFLLDKADDMFKKRYERYFVRELEGIKSKSSVVTHPLSEQMKQEVSEYYKAFGFDDIRTDWHEYIYAVTGNWSPQMIPEDFYHNILERIYNRKEINGWEDKCYMQLFLPDVVFPHTLVSNVNGYFLDENRTIITEEDAIKIIRNEEYVVVKPSRESGGGRGCQLIKSSKFSPDLLNQKDYVVQAKIKQSAQMAEFNPSSVNTEKILSFLFKGEVYILSAHMRVGAPNAFTDNASGGKGYIIGIKPDGLLENVGMNIYGDKRNADYNGNAFSGRKLEHHVEICDIIKEAHKKMPYFGFITWDFCVNENGTPVLIEYNTSSAEILAYQLTSGQVFGNLTEDVLKDAVKYVKQIRYSRL